MEISNFPSLFMEWPAKPLVVNQKLACSTSLLHCLPHPCLCHLDYITLLTSSSKIACSPSHKTTGHTRAWTKNLACSPRLSYPPSTGHAMPCVWTKICLLTKLLAYLIKITSSSLHHQAKSLLSKPQRRTGHTCVWEARRIFSTNSNLIACSIVTKLTKFLINH